MYTWKILCKTQSFGGGVIFLGIRSLKETMKKYNYTSMSKIHLFAPGRGHQGVTNIKTFPEVKQERK